MTPGGSRSRIPCRVIITPVRTGRVLPEIKYSREDSNQVEFPAGNLSNSHVRLPVRLYVCVYVCVCVCVCEFCLD